MTEIRLLAGSRHQSETDAAVIACNDYLRIGPARTLRELADIYADEGLVAPTRSPNTIKAWCNKFGWVRRAQAYDGRMENHKNALHHIEVSTGLALVDERLRSLKQVAQLLEEQLFEVDEDGRHRNLWLTEKKKLSGTWGDVQEIRRFNEALLRQYRQVLADIAAETGGRAQIVEFDWRKMLPPGVDPAGAERIFELDVARAVNYIESGGQEPIEGVFEEKVAETAVFDEIGDK